MKSEHRHQLQENDLEKLARVGLSYVEKYRRELVVGVSVVVVVGLVALVYTHRSRASQESAWAQLMAASTAEDYGNVADTLAGTVPGQFARLAEAERNLSQGIQLAFTDRPGDIEDISELKQARSAFERLLADKSAPAVIRERALYGMARYLTCVSDGDTSPAVDAYKRLLEEFPATVFREEAEKEIAYLQTGDAQTFYAWFHKQHPKPPERQPPQDVPEDAKSGTSNTPGTSAEDDESTPTDKSPAAGQPASADAGDGNKKVAPEDAPEADDKKTETKADDATRADGGVKADRQDARPADGKKSSNGTTGEEN